MNLKKKWLVFIWIILSKSLKQLLAYIQPYKKELVLFRIISINLILI